MSDTLALMNPAFAAAQRRAQYAQALMQGATSDAPSRSPWSVAAHLVNGLLGGYEMHGAQGDFQDINTQMQGEAEASRQRLAAIMSGGGGAPPTFPTQGAPTSSAPPAPTGTGDMSLPRGIRNNNPLNLKFAGQPGAGTDGTFAMFGDAPSGVAAAVRQLQTYGSRGITTLPAIVSTWAPKGDGNNDPDTYAKTVAAWTGLPLDKPLDLHDPDTLGKLVSGMGRFENGRALDPGAVTAGVAKAAMPPPGGGVQVAAANTGSVTDANPPVGGGGAPAPAPVPGQAPGAPTTAPNFQRAQALLQEALRMEASPNPFVQRMAASVRAQATALMAMGAWTDPMPVPNAPGQYFIRNQLSGETKFIGTAQRLTAASDGSLVGPDGHVVVQSPGYKPGPPTAAGQPTQVGPNGEIKPIDAGARPETQSAATVATISAKIARGEPITAEEKAHYAIAYNQLYPTTQKYVPERDQIISSQERAPPAGTPRPEDLPAIGAKPGAPATPSTGAPATGEPTSSPPTTPTATGPTATSLPGQTAQQIEAEHKAFNQRVEQAQTYATSLNTDVDKTRQLTGDTQTIRDLAASIKTGWGADTLADVRNFLISIGADTNPLDKVQVGNAQALQKVFLKATFDQVRQLGSREPGSVISMTAKAFPNIESQPEAVEIMTRALELHQRWLTERSQAYGDWLAGQTANATAAGHRFSEFKGPQDFASSGWDKTHDPRVYAAAGLIAAEVAKQSAGRGKINTKLYSRGLSPAQVDAAEQLAHDQWPSEINYAPHPVQTSGGG